MRFDSRDPEMSARLVSALSLLAVLVACSGGTGASSSGTSSLAVGTTSSSGLTHSSASTSSAGTSSGATASSSSATASSTSGSSGTSSGLPLTLDQFCPAFVTGFATLLSRCNGGPTDILALQFADSCRELTAGVAASRVTYDSVESQACIASLATVGCSALQTIATPADLPGCAGVLQGLATTDCYPSALFSECAEGNYCDPSQGCPGVSVHRITQINDLAVR
jgi:hypothetical protein